ncbi:MAG: hypothetical protein HY855_09055, partial [Burkholderiales bacterium]|nr:hypothetical protein [Burkholderiales bacterium]
MSADVQYPPRTEAERGAVEALVQAWGRLVHGLGTATGVQLDAGRSAAALAAATLAMALTLTLLQSLLFAPGGQGVEDFLGWAGPEGEAAVSALLRWWDDNGLRPFAWLYLGADTLLFMPIYGACFLTLALLLANGLCDDDPLNLSAHERWVLAGLAGPVLALLAVDLLENTLGLARMGVWAGVGGLVAAALCLRLLLALQAWRRLWGNAPAAAGERAAGRAPMKADRRAGAVAAGLALLALAGAWGSGGCGSAGLADFGA